MLDGLKALIGSEKALAIGLLVIAATVGWIHGDMTVDQWMDYTKWLAITYVSGKTVQGVAQVVAESKRSTSESSTVVSESGKTTATTSVATGAAAAPAPVQPGATP